MSDFTEYTAMAVGAVAIVGSGLVAIWSGRQDQARAQQRVDMNAMAGQITDSATRLTKIEAKIDHMSSVPDKLDDLKITMAEISGSQQTLLSILGNSVNVGAQQPHRRATDRKR